MKKIKLLTLTALAVFFSMAFSSCKPELIPEPTVDLNASKNPADFADAIQPPADLTATQGGYRNITLNWAPVENAIRYQIYFAQTPFDPFEKLVETTGPENKLDLEVPAGVSYYFTVRSVNYYESVSSDSIKAEGSSLAIPIITAIEAADDAQSVTVEWWMDNCSPTTYEDKVQFILTTYDSNKKPINIAPITVNGSERSAKVEGLEPKTSYHFAIEAKIIDSDQKSEFSDLTSKETTHSIIPKSVADFKASKGIGNDQVLLTWSLPEGADFLDAFSNTYKLNPVFFNVLRKDLSHEDNDYVSIAKIGTEGINFHYAPMDYTFNCKDETTSDSLVSIVKHPQNSCLDGYENYIPGSTLSFKDENVTKGVQYSYKVITYTDDTVKKYTPENTNKAVDTGWCISNAVFATSNEKHFNSTDSELIDSYDVSFKLTFNNMGVSYKYVLVETMTDLNDVETTRDVTTFDSIEALNNYKLNINIRPNGVLDTSKLGKYKYSLLIKTPDDIQLSEEKAIGIIQVTDERSNSPLEHFEITEGYSNKFIAKWNYNSNFTYDIEKFLFDSDETSEIKNPGDPAIVVTNPNTENGNAVFEIPAASGDIATFIINAYKDNKWCGSLTVNDRKHTLGTAKVTMNSPDYTSITVSWPKVQMAENTNYKVSAKYVDQNITTEELAQSEKTTITDKGEFIECTILSPTGYNNPLVSGKDIIVKITSKSSSTSDTTVGECIARTLGPAAINYSLNEKPSKNYIRLKWNKIEGVSKYMIYRVMYSDKNKTSIIAADTLIVNEDEISELQDQSTKNRSILTSGKDESGNPIYILTDTQYDSEEVFGYQLNQEKIQWGLPFGYLVLPLKNDSGKKDFEFEDLSLKLKSNSKVNYGTLTNKVSYTIGYGINLHAAKSESASKIRIEWNKPNNEAGLRPTIYRMPFVKIRGNDYGNQWEFVKTISSTLTYYEDEIPYKDSHKAFVYAVEYEPSQESSFVRSYRNDLAKDDVTDGYHFPEGIKEPNNKGYLFAIKGFKAGCMESEITEQDYFEENITWDPEWDFDERALVPEKFEVQIKNQNLASTANWIPVAEGVIDSEGRFSVKAKEYTDKEKTKTLEFWDTTVSPAPAGNGVNVKPKSLTDAITNPSITKEKLLTMESKGLLSVLRDTKHYYSLKITGNGHEDTQGANDSIYTYRQVTDTELAKCISIIIADVLYQTSIPTYTASALWDKNTALATKDGASGKFIISHYGGIGSDDLCTWGFDFSNYVHKFTSGTSSQNTKLTVSDISLYAGNSNSLSGIKGNKLYHLPPLEITVNHNSKLSSYKTNITFSAGRKGTDQKYDLLIKINDKTIVSLTDNYDEFIKWFPYWLNNSMSANPITEFTEGTTCPLYAPITIKDKTVVSWWN